MKLLKPKLAQSPHHSTILRLTTNTADTALQRRLNHVVWSAPRTWYPGGPLARPSIVAAQQHPSSAQALSTVVAEAPYWREWVDAAERP